MKKLYRRTGVADDPALPSYIPDDYTAQYESTQHLLVVHRQPLVLLATGKRVGKQEHCCEGFEQACYAGRRSAEGEQFHMATGDDHYTDLQVYSMTTSNRATKILMLLICGNDRAAFCGLSGSSGQGVRSRRMSP
ncbi:hypothetical protein ACNKHL_14565 [Shigella flexneri]